MTAIFDVGAARRRLALAATIAAFLAGCTGPIPDFVHDAIAEHEERNLSSVIRYRYKGQTVYYFGMGCCDHFNLLFDAEGELICMPDGGFSGNGDGRCPDFREEAWWGKDIWQAGLPVPEKEP